jgi:hypothetical protein
MAAWTRPTIGKHSAYTVLGFVGFVGGAIVVGTIYRRTSGERVGERIAVYALAADARHIYMEGSERIACIDGGG